MRNYRIRLFRTRVCCGREAEALSRRTRTSSAIRRSLVVTLPELGVPDMFPSHDSVSRPAPSLHRLPRVGFPASSVLLTGSDSPPPPFRFGSPSLGGSTSSSDPVILSSVEAAGPPRFLGDPVHACPALRPRRDPGARPLRRLGAAFRPLDGVGSRVCTNFGAQSHGLRARCLRFAASVHPSPGLPAPRKTRFRLVANLCRADICRGSSHEGFRSVRLHPFPLRQAYPGAPSGC